ncbi:hypothetical protein N7478_001964 [Penicillium angulare]|uniref:uncharacterized protein n=1 Tax=Penicillium angulare TaxID=116970 RepID=UPI0025407D8F|nr:uncharacterized protein N7478_001964 [Penicillium angulare]KAJ5288934.1 hypothetical protein N7478_001964 [Penicillium angulare]
MAKLFKGSHAAGIFADMSVDGPQIGTLVAIIDRAKNLPNRKTMGKQNPYCAARLGKEAKKTPTDLRGGQTPRWDHELRFTVHESPDYYKLKVSIFNDDKKTDLIGETWVDLNNLIIPGGSQDDHWHPLQSRGKYSGEVRIEMTYYDTRKQDEAVIEKRKGAADRVQGRQPAASPTTSTSSGLSGPRQLNAVKRRPLPTDPSGAAPPPRPEFPEQPQTAASLHHPMPERPIREQVQNMPTAPPLEPAPTQPYLPRHHSEPSYDQQPSAPPHSRAYDPHDYHYREREHSAPIVPPVPALPPAGSMRRNTYETSYANHEIQDPAYDPRPLQPRSHSDHDNYAPREYRQAPQEPSYEMELRGRAPYEQSRPSEDIYSPLSPQYSAPPMSFGPVSTFTPRNSGYIDEPAPLAYSRPNSSSGPAGEPRYQPHDMRALQPMRHDDRDVYHPEYAGMQPRVEDEDEDGPPPPPPVHRSRMAQQSQPAPSPARETPSPYQPYSPGQHSNASSMPVSLVAGYETEEPPSFDDRSGRRRSAHFDDEMMLSQPPGPGALVPVSKTAQPPPPSSYDAPVYPLRTSPRPIDERPTSSRGPSASPDTRMVTRKSVSPRPSISSDRERGSSIPFSPDSYNSLNPNASRSATSRDPTPVYDSPSQARDAAMRAEMEPVRHLDQPIIGDDGREIDPSDHLPTDTWAPEPERKNRKPEVIIRFKHNARPTSRGNEASTRSSGPPRVGFRTETSSYSSDRPRYTASHSQPSAEVERTPPRGYDNYGSHTQARGYSTPTSTERPRSSRGSVSPSPSSRSPLYDYSPGPPIPSKVPVSQGPPSYPVTANNPSSGNPGMDALSRELKTIDIGSSGCSPSRAVRRYAPPRASASMGYAS